MIKFITGNTNKLAEIKAVLVDLEQLDIDLPEIQSLNPQEIVEYKLKTALEHQIGDIIIEDTSLYAEGLKGLPGPLIKWFMKALGAKGLANNILATGNNRAEAKTIIGYADSSGATHYFEGSVKGQIVMPRGETTFGWDPIFQPDGSDLTFAEMGLAEKNKISMRRQAAQKLMKFIN